MLTRHSSSEQETLALGREIGSRLRPPRVVLLSGVLGSGKTVLSRGLAEGLQIGDPALVRSPTFTLVNEYPASGGVIHHIDLYRLEGLRDLYSIGLEELLEGPGVVIIEWAEKLLLTVEDPVRISIEVEPDARRRFLIEGIDLPDQAGPGSAP